MNKKYETMELEELARRAYLPPEALMFLEEAAFQVLTDWLKEHEAPEQVRDLFLAYNSLVFLMRVPPEAYPVEGRAQWNKEVTQVVGLVGWGIKAMGGSFGQIGCKALMKG